MRLIRSLLVVASTAVVAGAHSDVRSAEVAEQPTTQSAIAFVSSRHDPTANPAVDLERAWAAAEIYVMDEAGAFVRRLTNNAEPDGFPALSPDGSRIAFESNRRRGPGEPFNTSDLFLMKSDGSDQQFLIRGSSATWSPDGRRIAYHASASGNGKPIKPDPGAATSDSDIFIIDVSPNGKSATPRNVTNNPAAIDDDPDWSPDGKRIAFTSHAVSDDPINSATAEIYTVNADGTGKPARMTNNSEEERGPSWSPDGKRLAFSCRRGGPDFEICIMNADGTGQKALTDNAVPDLTPTWSPDGNKIVFHRRIGARSEFQLFEIHADGTGEKQLTIPPGFSAFPNWGRLKSSR